MNYFYSLPNDFSLDSLKDQMLLKSNIVDFNNRLVYNFNEYKSREKLNLNKIINKNDRENRNKYDNINREKDKNLFFPKEKDTLFWCYYINKYGLDDYLLNRKKSFTIEHEYKINKIEKLGNIKDELKHNKLRKIIIEDELINKNKIGIATIKLFMMIDKTNILIIKKNCYQRIVFDIDKLDINTNNYKIIFNDNENYYIYKYLTCKELKEIVEKKYEVEDLTKPLKSISSYKLNEMQEISKHLNINIVNFNGKNKTKQVLYNEILEKIV